MRKCVFNPASLTLCLNIVTNPASVSITNRFDTLPHFDDLPRPPLLKTLAPSAPPPPAAGVPRAVRAAAHHPSTRPRDQFEPEKRRDTTSRSGRSAHIVRVGARACAFDPSILKDLARRPVRPRSGCVVDTWCEARRCWRVQRTYKVRTGRRLAGASCDVYVFHSLKVSNEWST